MIDYWPIPLDQLIDSIDWPILLRDAPQPARWMKLGTVTNVYDPNETNNAVERMSRTLKKETNLWEYLFLNDETFRLLSMWHEVMYFFSIIACDYFGLQWNC